MSGLKIARIIAGISIVVGTLVIIGWYLDLTALTSILPQWIRMKVATASCFVFSGIVVYFLTLKKEEHKTVRQIVLTIFPTLIILMMGTLFLGSIFGFQTGMENIAFIDVHEINTPIFQGRPSTATMISFFLIASIGLLFNFSKLTKIKYIILGSIIGIFGFIGVLGYVFQVPLLYYEIPRISNAIAAHTTILFTLLGVAILLIGQTQNE